MLDLNVIELDGALRWFPLHNPAAADDQGGQVETQVLAAEDSHLLYKGEYHSENLSILGGGGGVASKPHPPISDAFLKHRINFSALLTADSTLTFIHK